MGISKKDFQHIAEELGKIKDEHEQRLVCDFLCGIVPQISVSFDEERFRQEVEHQYYINYGN